MVELCVVIQQPEGYSARGTIRIEAAFFASVAILIVKYLR